MSVAPSRPSAPGIPGADELVSRARALAPKLRQRAIKAERDRNIPRESVDDYIAAGLIHTLQPKRCGGYEHDHETMFNIAIELGKSTCGSSAWCLNYLGDHACILAHFPEEAQHDVWSRDTAACIATSAAPTGKSAVASGGYRLDGRWSWCSGLRHSQWIIISGLVFREGDHHPDMRLHLVPTSEVKQEDTWFCAGLSASGSNTVVLDYVFVPEHRSVSSRRCATRTRPAPRSTPIRSTALRSSRCIPTHCSARRSAWRAAPTTSLCSGPSSDT
jgi:3-hydroxy-9,10-secoandrosta-1,3,5(10)-triene-9,17-dione monooxygenase